MRYQLLFPLTVISPQEAASLLQPVGWLKSSSFTVGLAPYRGKTVKLELCNQPTGWSNEAASWGEITVSGNNN